MTRLSALSRSIEGQVAVVTGAASGMGRATALLLADEGARVALVDLGEDRLAPVVAAIRGAGHEAEGYAVDLSDGSAIGPLVDAIAERFGALDILVNNAGVSLPAPVDGEGPTHCPLNARRHDFGGVHREGFARLVLMGRAVRVSCYLASH